MTDTMKNHCENERIPNLNQLHTTELRGLKEIFF